MSERASASVCVCVCCFEVQYVHLHLPACVFVVCVAFNAHQRGGPHMTYLKPRAFSTTFNVLACAAF